MNKFFYIFLSVFFLVSCGNNSPLDERINQLEKLYKKRKDQKAKEIADIKKYKYIAEEEYNGCDCSQNEFQEDYELSRYLSEFKEMGKAEIMTYMNCGQKQLTAEGMAVLDYSMDAVSEFISLQIDQYGFNPYELSIEQAELLTKDSTFQKIFPYKIKDFGSFNNFTSDIFTYEMFKGFTNDNPNIQDGVPVRIMQPDGYADPLSWDEITEYHYVLRQIVEDYIFEENVHYYFICPSRYEKENNYYVEDDFATDDDTFLICAETYEAPPVEGPDSDNDGLSDLDEDAFGSNPEIADSDGDGFNDGDEVNLWFTDPIDSGSIPSDDEVYFFENCEEKP